VWRIHTHTHSLTHTHTHTHKVWRYRRHIYMHIYTRTHTHTHTHTQGVEVAAPAPYTQLRLEDLVRSSEEDQLGITERGVGRGKGGERRDGAGKRGMLDTEMTVQEFLDRLKAAPQVCGG